MKKPKNIEKNSQLLKGIGSSAWFHIAKEDDDIYRIKRYAEDGEMHCSNLFKTEMENFNIDLHYEFTYISHCNECRIIQDNKIYLFKNVENKS